MATFTDLTSVETTLTDQNFANVWCNTAFWCSPFMWCLQISGYTDQQGEDTEYTDLSGVASSFTDKSGVNNTFTDLIE